MSLLLSAGDRFKFSCHENLACFKKCCRDINIFLTPYDVLRLKNKLKISSQEFLEKYAIVHNAPYSGFPVVLLRMRESDLACPFITSQGCGVYEERPWSCRMAPLEIRSAGRYGFCFDSSFCLGLKEAKEQTVAEWMRDQGMEVYEEVEKSFNEIPLRLKLDGDKKINSLLARLFFMASYDLDNFRRFILGTGFAGIFGLPGELVEKVRKDDVALMRFGFDWLVSGITGDETLKKLEELLIKLTVSR